MSCEAPKSLRNEALDFAKGMLVVCMVIYHSLNYSTRPELGFQYMAFLPPSFILITGFLIARVYSARVEAGDKTVWKRLLVRGAKLLALFTALNVLVGLMRGNGMTHILEHARDIYLAGSGQLAAFEVLLPIAYLLLIAPVLLSLGRWNSTAVPVATLAMLLFFAILEHRGSQYANGSLVAAGLAGMVLGRSSDKHLDLLGRYWPVTLVLYGLYVVLSQTFGQPYLIQLLGAVVALVVFYGLGVRVGARGMVPEKLQLLGQYSLVSYIAQIAVLQLLSRCFRRPPPDSLAFVALLSGTLLLTVVSVELIDRARRRSSSINGVYKTVFA